MKLHPALALFLLLSAPAIAGAQIIPVDMDSLVDETSSYTHIGEGRLMSMRSCRMQWLGIRFTVAEFDRQNSILTVEGEIFQSNVSYHPEAGPVMLMVGPMTGRTGMGNSIQVRERRSLGDDGTFRARIIVRPGDALCFSQVDPPADSLGNRRITSGSVKLYYIDRLAEGNNNPE